MPYGTMNHVSNNCSIQREIYNCSLLHGILHHVCEIYKLLRFFKLESILLTFRIFFTNPLRDTLNRGWLLTNIRAFFSSRILNNDPVLPKSQRDLSLSLIQIVLQCDLNLSLHDSTERPALSLHESTARPSLSRIT